MSLILLAATLLLGNQPDNDAQARFLKEYPAASLRLEKALTHVRGKARIVNGYADIGQQVVNTVSFVYKGDKRKFDYVIVNQPKDQPPRTCLVHCLAGPDSFQLRGSDPAKYRLQGVGDDPKTLGIFHTIFGRYPEVCWAILGERLSSIIQSRDFHIIEANYINAEQHKLVRLEFSYGSFQDKACKYRVVLDPQLDWAITRSEFNLGVDPSKWEVLEIKSMATFANGQIYPQEVLYLGPTGKKQTCLFDSVTFTDVDDGEFKLKHYGLTDVAWAKPKSSSILMKWALAFGVVILLLIFSVFLKKLSNRV